MRDHLACHHPAHIGFSAWIADHRRSAPHQNDRDMARALHMRHRHQLYEMADMEAAVRENSPGFFTRLGNSLSAGWNGVLEFFLQVVKLWPLWVVLALVIVGLRRLRRK